MEKIPLIKGKELDSLALKLGLKRHKKFIFFQRKR